MTHRSGACDDLGMLLHILTLLAATLPGGMVDADRLTVSDTATGIWAATCTEDGCDTWMASVLAVTAAEESRGRPGQRGDSGAACGRYQLHAEWRQGHSCDELDGNATLDAALARDALRALERACGSRQGALAAYASGKCDWGMRYATRRCAAAGGC